MPQVGDDGEGGQHAEAVSLRHVPEVPASLEGIGAGGLKEHRRLAGVKVKRCQGENVLATGACDRSIIMFV